MTDRICRWGILGTAGIARKSWQALRLAGNARLVAVASRQAARAAQFIAECQAHVPMAPEPQPCGGYDELLRRDDIDAVYIPLPTGVRKEWVIRAAEAGKHVLCEKPCGVTAADVRAMLDACQRHDVQFMDGVMFMHSIRLAALRQTIDDGHSVGPIRRIAAQFSFRAPDDFLAQNIRANSQLEPLGCLGDLGWYTIRFALWVMNGRLPDRVAGWMLAQHGEGDAAVPMEFSAELFYPDGVSAAFYCSFLAENQQWAHVSGTHGLVHLSDFVLPYFGCETAFTVAQDVFRIEGCDFNMEHHARRVTLPEYANSHPSAQETNMVRHFSDLVLSGRREPQWGEMALTTQQVLDACLASARDGGRLVAVG